MLSGARPPRRGSPAVQRAFDLLVGGAAAVLLSPVMVMVAVAVRVWIGSPVLFRQVRPGRGGQPFAMVKFRTMREAYDAAGNPLPDEQRTTPVGRFLRSTSLDELPELFNVLRGEMSLVGPRPLLMQYLPLYSPEQARRHDVRPGITGWAQVNGRNALSWEDKFALDVWYVDHRSLWVDLRIMALTVKQVFVRHGIVPEGRESVDFFRGTPPPPERPEGAGDAPAGDAVRAGSAAGEGR